MKLFIEMPDRHYHNIMSLDAVSLGRIPYKGIIMYAINAIKHGKILDHEPTTKNNLGVDCISRADARSLVCKIGRKDVLGMSGKTFQDLYKGIDDLSSVTPQLSSETRKNSKKLEKDFGELDCISREQAIEGVWEIELAGLDNKKVVDMLKALPSVTPQEPKIKVLDYDEVARKLGTVDIYKASAWITLLKDLEYLGLKICEVKK